MVRHPDVAMVSLTGDVGTGKEIARAAADTLKRVHLELGGKAPVIVFDDADLEAAIEGVEGRRLLQRRPGLHGGDARARGPEASTTTSSPGSRQAAGWLAVGDPASDGHRAGPARLGRAARARERLPRPRARPRRARHRRRRDRRPGASSSSRPSSPGSQQDDEMVQREVFGPVVTVQRFSSDEEALDVGERRRLRAGGDASGRATSAARCARRDALRFGTVWVNDHIPLVVGDAARRLQAVRLRQGHDRSTRSRTTPRSST